MRTWLDASPTVVLAEISRRVQRGEGEASNRLVVVALYPPWITSVRWYGSHVQGHSYRYMVGARRDFANAM